ncbi:family 16 glycosylhydrolase [Promicromonospora sp. Populi]|uniref:family 16 glycosylhydrolase n=1 Tax=Promicromonospora sp. Populi TaxID=3239420 RepID=UPI0034E2FCE8
MRSTRHRTIRSSVTAVAALTLVLSASLVASAAAPQAPEIGTAADAPPDFSTAALLWSDEFNGAAGSGPSAANWNQETGGGGWGNNELQVYTNSRNNSAMDGAGNLVITARREGTGYTSARLTTANRVERQYGYLEARIQIPRGQGIWPAFWMLGSGIDNGVPWPNSGEIDIMENIGREPTRVHGTLHGPGYSGATPITGSYVHPQNWAFADTFHTFAINWSPNSITWYVDGVAYQTFTPANLGGDTWVFNQPFFFILNVAVGGNWPGYPDGTTQFPQTMRIDYVRVYDTPPTGGGRTGTVTASNGICLDVAGAATANGTPIQLATCNGNAAQQWTVGTDGTLRAFGKCLDVAGGGTAAGTAVQLWDCNGTGAQQWTSTAGTLALRNPQSGRCLQPIGGVQTNGTRTQIADCNGSTAQRWTLPS